MDGIPLIASVLGLGTWCCVRTRTDTENKTYASTVSTISTIGHSPPLLPGMQLSGDVSSDGQAGPMHLKYQGQDRQSFLEQRP